MGFTYSPNPIYYNGKRASLQANSKDNTASHLWKPSDAWEQTKEVRNTSLSHVMCNHAKESALSLKEQQKGHLDAPDAVMSTHLCQDQIEAPIHHPSIFSQFSGYMKPSHLTQSTPIHFKNPPQQPTERQNPMHTQPPNQHIHFAPLPKPDHATGHITYPTAFHLRWPACGAIAQRRVSARDAKNERCAREDFLLWRQNHPEAEMHGWEEVRWAAEPHPGRRVWGLGGEEEGLVSPTSDAVLVVAPRGVAVSIGCGEVSWSSTETCDALLEDVLLKSSRPRIGRCCTLQ